MSPNWVQPSLNTERYGQLTDAEFATPFERPLSTFSVDVDTASFTNLRRMLTQRQHVPPDAVRVEEMINYFDYDYAPPVGPNTVAVHLEQFDCPWAPGQQLLRIGLKAQEIARDERPAANLVFLIDVSGSMNSPDKLPWVKDSMHRLLDNLNAEDRVGIVVYASQTGVVAVSTAVDAEGLQQLRKTIDLLSSGGSTNGGSGIRQAYAMARNHFIEGGVNRVILATDGDFNVGVTSSGEFEDVSPKGGRFRRLSERVRIRSGQFKRRNA
ncbi:MAG: von Willebrand factor type A domain-containing protein [Verrucomicrobiota bacterium]